MKIILLLLACLVAVTVATPLMSRHQDEYADANAWENDQRQEEEYLENSRMHETENRDAEPWWTGGGVKPHAMRSSHVAKPWWFAPPATPVWATVTNGNAVAGVRGGSGALKGHARAGAGSMGAGAEVAGTVGPIHGKVRAGAGGIHLEGHIPGLGTHTLSFGSNTGNSWWGKKRR